MQSSIDIQNKYVNMYKVLRNYLLPFESVEDLANLEIAVYTAFPNLKLVKERFNRLKSGLFELLRDDEELRNAFDELSKVIEACEDSSKLYYRLLSVNH